MAKQRTIHRCQECGHAAARWAGQCSACQAWGTLVEEGAGGAGSAGAARPNGLAPVSVFDPLAGLDLDLRADVPVPLVEVSAGDAEHFPSGIGELDRVLGGGLVPGAAILLGGEPGIGKSTLLAQVLHRRAEVAPSPVLLVTAEESKSQVRLRAERLGALHPRAFVVAEESVAAIVGHLRDLRPSLAIVDSIQTVRDPRLESAAGSVAQVRESAAMLIREAKALDCTLVLVGHVTKEGNLAGPRVLEHLVDVVLAFEGDRHHALRVVRGVKNRFGPAGELGLFEMRADGLAEVVDPSGVFVGERRPTVSGTAVGALVEGARPLLVEVQALVARAGDRVPRRSIAGPDPNRVNVLAGVLDKRAKLPCGSGDLFVAAAGGVRVSDPGADLALCMAIASSTADAPVPPDVAFIGEVGLGGEVRPVAHLDRRVREAARFGFARVVVPAASAKALPVPDGVVVVPVEMLSDALGLLRTG